MYVCMYFVCMYAHVCVCVCTFMHLYPLIYTPVHIYFQSCCPFFFLFSLYTYFHRNVYLYLHICFSMARVESNVCKNAFDATDRVCVYTFTFVCMCMRVHEVWFSVRVCVCVCLWLTKTSDKLTKKNNALPSTRGDILKH